MRSTLIHHAHKSEAVVNITISEYKVVYLTLNAYNKANQMPRLGLTHTDFEVDKLQPEGFW